MDNVLLYMTAANQDEATKIARNLLQDRLVACVNILPSMRSLYWWNDEIQDDSETAFLAKTTRENVEPVIQRVREIHSYDCPCVVTLPIEKGNPDFLNWINEQTKKG